MTQADAQKRVDDVDRRRPKTAADKARKSTAAFALWLVASMLAGALSASLAAIEGGNLRNREWYLAAGESPAFAPPSNNLQPKQQETAMPILLWLLGLPHQPDHRADASGRGLMRTQNKSPASENRRGFLFVRAAGAQSLCRMTFLTIG